MDLGSYCLNLLVLKVPAYTAQPCQVKNFYTSKNATKKVKTMHRTEKFFTNHATIKGPASRIDQQPEMKKIPILKWARDLEKYFPKAAQMVN